MTCAQLALVVRFVLQGPSCKGILWKFGDCAARGPGRQGRQIRDPARGVQQAIFVLNNAGIDLEKSLLKGVTSLREDMIASVERGLSCVDWQGGWHMLNRMSS